MKQQTYPSLAQLRIGSEWTVEHHQLYELDPRDAEDLKFDNISVWSFVFVQDLLQLKNKEKNLLLDVGWYPEGHKQGCYKLVLLEGNQNMFNWDKPKFELQTRSLNELLNEIERITISPYTERGSNE